MALSITMTKMAFGENIVLKNTYHQIIALPWSKDDSAMSVLVRVLDSTRTHFVEERVYRFTPSLEDSSSNFVKQAYEHIKSLPEYEGAVDILEEGQVA